MELRPAGALTQVVYNGIEVYRGKRAAEDCEVLRWALPVALQCASVEDLLEMTAAWLLERQVLVVADKSVRSAVVLVLLALCKPWCSAHTVLPVVPLEQRGFVTAPVPFLLGVACDESILKQACPPPPPRACACARARAPSRACARVLERVFRCFVPFAFKSGSHPA